ncbi:MAG: Uma2 family endonuclease, partial [Syntrophomonas sp.]
VNESYKYEGVPALVVEVLSQSTKGKDMVVKLNLYMKSGIKEYWVVDLEKKSILQYSFSPERDIENLKIFEEEETIESTVFSGLKISLVDIFSEI